jgi:Raf kinase inhibitor-like YbhB/YbcL family protein
MLTRIAVVVAGAALAAGLTGFPTIPSAGAQQPKPDAFTITVPGFAEAAFLKSTNASSDPGCGGDNISPAIQWTHPPAGTRSFAVTIMDPDGQKGLGSVHWIAYGIPASVAALPERSGTSSTKDLIAGKNSRGQATYRGPCPPAGEQPHHYVIAVYALDLEPGALPPALDRDGFHSSIDGHVLNETSVVLRYAR